MQGDIPLELIISAAIGIILLHRPIAPDNPCVVFSKQAKAIAKQAERDISKSANLLLSNFKFQPMYARFNCQAWEKGRL